MPYYLETDDRELLKKLLHTHVCSTCGGELESFYDMLKHLPYLQCKTHPKHEGIGKPNKKEDNSYQGGLKQMTMAEKEHGLDKARALVKYQGVTSLTRTQAMEILETIWPDAPEVDKVAAAILCSSYGLNPLAGHVFLIKFKDKWVRVWGIKAKRLLASRKGGYSYLDMTPRLMTEAEQVKVWGAVDTTNLGYLTWLKHMITGAEVYGYGKWPKNQEPYGTDKGNSKANMASIRSESQAIDRLRPAEMPTGFVVADEQYIEAEGGILQPKDTGEYTFTPIDLVDKSNLPPDNAGPQTGVIVEAGDVIPPVDSLVTPEDITRLDTEMRKAKWDNMRFGKYAMNDKGWVIKTKKDLTKSQVEEAIKDIVADSVKKGAETK